MSPIQHKFYNTNFGDGFETQNAILSEVKYKPEVMIVGTFNPSTPNANFADFYYGRNFFWRTIKYLFTHNQVILNGRRMPTRGNPPNELDPTLPEIFKLCASLKMTFADLILEVLHNNNPYYQLLENDNVVFNGVEYNLIQDGKKGNIHGLAQLNHVNQINWNTQNIINYLCANPQIRTIYLTRRPIGIWAEQWNLIADNNCMKDRQITNLFTPSAAGKPVYYSIQRLLNHWVHNNDPNFGRLDNDWLVNNNVEINNF